VNKKPREAVVCPVCGKVFVSPFAYRRAKYCSRECWGKRSGTNASCPVCGKVFRLMSCVSGRKKFCSKACYTKDQESRRGAKTGNWKGGRTKTSQLVRTRALYLRWRTRVFERDSYICQDCGAKCGDGKRVLLNAHHILSFADNPAKRFDVDNGLTLCRQCHEKRHPHLAAQRMAQEVLPL